jgi:hypothetical protein
LSFNAGFLLNLFLSTLKMEAICSSETSVDTRRTTRHYIPEDCTLQVIISSYPDKLGYSYINIIPLPDSLFAKGYPTNSLYSFAACDIRGHKQCVHNK